MRDLVSDRQKVGKSWKKLGGFGQKLGLFGQKLVVFWAKLRGDFSKCAQPILPRLPILTGQKDSPPRREDTKSRLREALRRAKKEEIFDAEDRRF